MTPERFRQIERLYHAAREGSAEERAALLAKVDPVLRRDLESLLSDPTGSNLLDRPAIQNATPLLEDATVTVLASGACLGPYRIESKLGEGGMGEVFRAVDTRLGRAVAIKTAHQQFTARFEREARAIAALNHPHICALYDVGPNYLVMELVEGETIAECLKRGPMPVEMVRRYGAQIAAALAEAHGKGIIHRDLKPGNIMIGKSGVKVLDFGLARSGQDETLTASRMVMGTPAYMAPEQRDGRPADARSDVYSFGRVLYEMLTGARVTSQRKRIPSRKLERIVSRCLEEEPARRWQSAAELERELGATAGRARHWHVIVPAAAAVLALCAAGYFYYHRAPKLTDKDTIVLADFTNKTGDPVFDGTLRQGLAVQLEQSPFLSLLSEERIRKTLGLMGRPPDAALTAPLAKEICERTASAAVLDGSIASFGSRYVLGLRARNCRTGDVLDEEQAQAARKEDVPDALSQMASKFRTRVGESLATVAKYSTPLAEATTPSLEALKAYSAARQVHYSSTGGDAAVRLYQRAIGIDPQFAIAYAYLGTLYGEIGESDLAAETIAKAYRLRDRASEAEKFFIGASYDIRVTGNLQEAQRTCEAWAHTYPRDGDPHGFLAGIVYLGFGKYGPAVEEAEKAVEAEPDRALRYDILAEDYEKLDRFDEAEKALERASRRKLEIPYFFMHRYDIAFWKGDQPGMERTAALGLGKPGAEELVLDHEAFVLAYSGRLQQARKVSQRVVDLAKEEGNRERAALFEAGAALWEAFFGRAAAARQTAQAAVSLAKDREVEFGAAFALALAEDLSRSQSLADDMEKHFPEDTAVRFSYLPALRGLIALKHGEFPKALEALQTAAPYELGTMRSTIQGSFGALYPVYVRGEAYLALNRGAEAAAEFRKILDHRGLTIVDPIGALAHWRLGRALALSGDTAKAKAAYADFLTLWKEADTELPVLKQAQAEYARLK